MGHIGSAEWLTIINGAWGQAAFCLALVMLFYIRHEAIALRIWKRWARIPQGMRIACTLLLIAAGVLITRWLIYSWRIFFGGGEFSERQTLVLIWGGVVGLCGFLWAIKEYSQPLYGRWVWVASAISVLGVAALTALRYF